MISPSRLTPDSVTRISLPSGIKVDLPICHQMFLTWSGVAPTFDFGKKPILDFGSKPTFAELVILHLLQTEGWEGAWIETYGGVHYLQDMPTDWKLKSGHVAIPAERETLLKRIWEKGKTTACFDVYAWKGDNILFCEAKHKGKDRLTDAQYKFIEAALACGVKTDQLLVVEWDYAE